MVHLSEGCGKMAGIWSINTNPLTNPFCNKMAERDHLICSRCYSRSLVKGFFKHIKGGFESNSVALSCGKASVDTSGHDIIRMHSHGELINKTHLENMISIAKENEGTRFVLWTKRAELVREAKMPDNMYLVYSSPEINPIEPILPEGFDKTFSTYTKEYALESKQKINCEGKCRECMKCYTNNSIVHILEVVKSDQEAYEIALNGGEKKAALLKRLHEFSLDKPKVSLGELYKTFPEEEQYVIRARLNEAVKQTSLGEFRLPFKRVGKGEYKALGRN